MDLLLITMALLPWIAECKAKPVPIKARASTDVLTLESAGTEGASAIPSHRAPEL
jgi:hypothetical protein